VNYLRKLLKILNFNYLLTPLVEVSCCGLLLMVLRIALRSSVFNEGGGLGQKKNCPTKLAEQSI
jgi:hypothetical protein